MSYNTDHLRTAGKVTVYTTLLGVLIFAVVFIFNLGATDINTADAQSTATTSVTVLNTPPLWTVDAEEQTESSQTNPTNAGDTVTWVGTATDPNGEDYYLLICDGNATPTANAAAAPDCGAGDVQWGVSTATLSGTEASVSTTTEDGWAESNVWYAWICDGNAGTPRCNATSTQGSASTASPFEVNHRPTFTDFWNDSPVNPGDVVTFTSTSSDSDVSGTADTVKLFVCSTASFDDVSDTCTATTLASSTVAVSSNATATYSIVIPTQDQDYAAYGFVIDSHGFEASGGSQGSNATITVSNVAPTVSAASISLNGGSDMVLSVESDETTGFTIDFTTSDNNSCDAVGGGNGDEVIDYELSVYRNGTANGSTTCQVDAAGNYDPNDCYTSAVATTTWNIACTASTTSCTGTETMDWSCTFPLWYIADPTDGTATSTQYPTDDWRAQVRAIDDDFATGTLSESTVADIEVTSFLAFALNDTSIPYGALEPGEQTDPLVATTTISATGNVGLDKDVQGDSMCSGYTVASPCAPSSTSTIPASEQRFSTTTSSYAAATSLSSTTPQEIEVNVPKSTATSTQANSSAYWGIRVPGTITFSGSYTGRNTITAIVGESADW